MNLLFKNFIKYVSLNILGMIGLSCYILADTFFISKALGALGITALNLSISIYSVIHGTGLMIGIGGATRYRILKSQNNKDKANITFTTSVKLGLLLGLLLVVVGIFGSKALAILLGADASTLPLTQTYLTTILCFAPFFITNNVILAFVRNDDNPNLSMIAMLTGSFSNIILDYVFMFPLGMGMFGAAFATGLAPIISIGVLSIHFISKNNHLQLIRSRIEIKLIFDIFSLGVSAFITEVSSAVVLITFNLVILGLEGNIGVASYGIVANIALVGISIFTGIAQGMQPLISREYGLRNKKNLARLIRYALVTSLIVATSIYLVLYLFSEDIANIFNSEQNLQIAQQANAGLKIYFIGFFFAGINIILSAFLSATEKVRGAFLISMARGCVVIIPMVLILSILWRMTGVWFSFVFTEGIVTLYASFLVIKRKRGEGYKQAKLNRAKKGY